MSPAVPTTRRVGKTPHPSSPKSVHTPNFTPYNKLEPRWQRGKVPQQCTYQMLVATMTPRWTGGTSEQWGRIQWGARGKGQRLDGTDAPEEQLRERSSQALRGTLTSRGSAGTGRDPWRSEDQGNVPGTYSTLGSLLKPGA